MMRFDEYRKLDATAMASLVAAGEITAFELLNCAYERHQQVNGKINAIINPMFTNARRYLRKESPGGELTGVPIVLKVILPTNNGHFAKRPF